VNVTISLDIANNGSLAPQRPNRVLGQPARIIVPGDKTQGWLNPAAFSVPAPFTFGTLGRNSDRGPNFIDFDFGIFKNFPIHGERQMLQFRSEFFNIDNHTNLGSPGSLGAVGGIGGGGVGTFGPTFGRIFTTATNSREIQLALKLIF
jgi:hypothetical protein